MPAIGIGGGSWRLLLLVLYRYNAVSGSKHGGFKRRGKGHGRHWPQLAGFGRHWPHDEQIILNDWTKFCIFEVMIDSRQQQIIKKITAKFNPSLVGVFGSYARGQQGTHSDLDILIDFSHRVNLLDLIGLENELSKKLGIKVDLVTASSLHQHLRPMIERDLIRIT